VEDILSFLANLQDRYPTGPPPVQFLLHQRLWFNPADSAGHRYQVNAFVGSLTTVINAARPSGLDRWIAGVRLGEHSDTDWADLLPLIARLAEGINAATDGWLNRDNHMFLANGGGWGADYAGSANHSGPTGPLQADGSSALYKGIVRAAERYDRTSANGTRYKSFFADMSRQVGQFAFAYKFMDSRNDASWNMARSLGVFCRYQGPCSTASIPFAAEDWRRFLDDGAPFGKGFHQLELVIDGVDARSHRDRFGHPFANVVFVGDSSDSASEFLSDPAYRNAAQGIERLFAPLRQSNLAWSGKIFSLYANSLLEDFPAGGQPEAVLPVPIAEVCDLRQLYCLPPASRKRPLTPRIQETVLETWLHWSPSSVWP
jgi:hypothetical protein